MIKKYKKQLLITSFVILLPILIGLILWNVLPDRLATHWGADGNADGWGSKAAAIFATPLTLLAAHWFCIWITAKDPKAKDQSKKAFGMLFWICPCVSLFSSAMIYALALGVEFNIVSIMFAALGIMFMGIGNYLPKCKQNYTLGIKTPWALHNEENWNATHRFGGRIWVTGGLALILLAFLPVDHAILPMNFLILVFAFAPAVYSWLYYKKQCKAGSSYKVNTTPMDRRNRLILKGTLIFVAAVFLIVGFLLFSGDIEYTFNEDSFTINASYWNELTVDYDEITDIELRFENVSGTRTWGLGSFRLLLGAFENEEFGSYTRYTYYDPGACVVVTCGGKTLVLSGPDAEHTKAIYEELAARSER